MHPRPVGPVVFSLLSSVAHFWRDEGVRGQRLDIYPRVSHSLGGDVVFSQTLGLRETAYALSQQGPLDQTLHRESFDYNALVHARLMRRYGALTHIVEPSLGFSFIPKAGPELPSFDSVELYKKTAATTVSVLNRFRDGLGEFLTLRLSQAYDAYQNDHHLKPFVIEAAVKRPLSLRAEVTYDYGKTRVGTANADLGIPVFGGLLSIGERYEKDENILAFTVGSAHHITKELLAESGFYIDARDGGVKYLMGKLKYQKQCWGITAVMSKRQNDYAFSVFLDLLGLGTVRF
jgi:LPS-assembly protein